MLNGWNVPLSGLQLGYTVVFGSYASFLFIQTGRWLLTLLCIIAIISLVHNIGFSRYLYYKIVHYQVCVRQAFSFPSWSDKVKNLGLKIICHNEWKESICFFIGNPNKRRGIIKWKWITKSLRNKTKTIMYFKLSIAPFRAVVDILCKGQKEIQPWVG